MLCEGGQCHFLSHVWTVQGGVCFPESRRHWGQESSLASMEITVQGSVTRQGSPRQQGALGQFTHTVTVMINVPS